MQLISRREALEAVAARTITRRGIYSELFPKQRAVVRHKNKRKTLCCGRRSGKTNLLDRKLGAELDRAGPNEGIFYAGLTKGIARRQVFPLLIELNERHGLHWDIREHTSEVLTPAGGRLALLGMEKITDIEKLRGFKSRLVMFDEVQSYASKLEELIATIVEPSLGDLDGELWVSGTPGKVPIGYWYDLANGKTHFQSFNWNVTENPEFRDGKGEQWLAEIRAKFGWTEDNATYQQEYLGKWALDTRELAFDFQLGRNTCDFPHDYSSQWLHVIGLDFGYDPDPTAWVVLAQRPHTRTVYAVHVEKGEKMLGDEIALRTKFLIHKYNAKRVGADAADPRLIEEFNRRYASATGLHVEAVNKLHKAAQIGNLNTEFRTARLLCVVGQCDDLIPELLTVQWKDREKGKLEPAQPNDCCDALQYGYSLLDPQWATPVPAPEDEQTKARRARQAAERRRVANEW